jgi:light-regulated signal transduction histidine kinase (bacteriophytochrome)
MRMMSSDNEAEVASLQAQLRTTTARLEAANSELEMLCHAVSHDLRAPLRAIDGFTRMLLQRCEGRLEADELRLLHVVRTNSATMNRLIDDIVDFARLSRDPLRVVDVDMGDLVSQAWSEVAAEFAGEMRVQSLPPARGDRALFKQMWVHLLSNAVKFSARSAAPVVMVGGERQGDETVYTVRDNGVGFDMHYADKLFKAFQRLHGASEFPGNGIGLASVARIVKRHGGRVGAESHAGQGATFWFALPIAGVFG